jgi:hypothetical protein
MTNSSTHAHSHDTHPHTGVDGGPCSSCSTGKYKSGPGSAACSTCPLNSNSPSATTQQSDCKCNPGYTGGDQHPRQTQEILKTTHAQHPNTHMNMCSNKTTHYTLIFIRKHQTDTRSQTHLRTHTQRRTHLCTGEDGGTCEECSTGKYKNVSGSVACSTCPLNSNSSAVSTNQSDCKCDPGYTGEDQHPRQT